MITAQRARPAAPRRQTAPLMLGQDPSVAWRKGSFYLVQSENGERGVTGIFVYKSPTLHSLATGERTCIWRAPRSGPLSKNVWAPELAWVDGFGPNGEGRWYVHFAADDGRNERHRMYALESTSEDAASAYILKGKVASPDDHWAIDGALIDVELPVGGGRRLYFVWSGWAGATNGMQRIYIAPMENPWTISGPRVEISRPCALWERRSGPTPCYVNEGPAVAVHHGKVVISFSANGFWSDHYCLGLLSCDLERLFEPAAWTKSSRPVFTPTDDLFGTGHNCFTHVPHGPDAGWWNLFHATRRPNRHGKGREIFAQKFTWHNGLPQLGRPGAATLDALRDEHPASLAEFR